MSSSNPSLLLQVVFPLHVCCLKPLRIYCLRWWLAWRVTYREEYKLWNSSLYNSLQPRVTSFLLGPYISVSALFSAPLVQVIPLMQEDRFYNHTKHLRIRKMAPSSGRSPWWWRQNRPLKRWQSYTSLHGGTTQTTAIFILTAVWTSSHILVSCSWNQGDTDDRQVARIWETRHAYKIVYKNVLILAKISNRVKTDSR
jgi:hypothetical protein